MLVFTFMAFGRCLYLERPQHINPVSPAIHQKKKEYTHKISISYLHDCYYIIWAQKHKCNFRLPLMFKLRDLLHVWKMMTSDGVNGVWKPLWEAVINHAWQNAFHWITMDFWHVGIFLWNITRWWTLMTKSIRTKILFSVGIIFSIFLNDDHLGNN